MLAGGAVDRLERHAKLAAMLAVAAVTFSFARAPFAASEHQCGSYEIRTGSKAGHETLSVADPGGGDAYRVRAARIGAWRCEDLSGDGVPELVFASHSDGSRCCTTHLVLSMTRPPRLLLRWESGVATDLELSENAGANQPRVLTGEDDRLINFGGLPTAFSPLLPVAFCFKDGRYVDCSEDSFAHEALTESMGAELARLDAELSAIQRKAIALRLLALARRADEQAMALSWVRQSAPEAAAWLFANWGTLDRCLTLPATAPRARRLRACDR